MPSTFFLILIALLAQRSEEATNISEFSFQNILQNFDWKLRISISKYKIRMIRETKDQNSMIKDYDHSLLEDIPYDWISTGGPRKMSIGW